MYSSLFIAVSGLRSVLFAKLGTILKQCCNRHFVFGFYKINLNKGKVETSLGVLKLKNKEIIDFA